MTARRSPGPVLAGCSILIAGVRHGTSLSTALERRGANVLRVPEPGNASALHAGDLLTRTGELIADAPDVVVVTSGAGFRAWTRMVHANDLSDALFEMFARTRLVAWGPRAEGAVRHAGLTCELVVASDSPDEIGAYVRDRGLRGGRVAVQRHGARTDALDALLVAHGVSVVSVPVVGSGTPPDPLVVRRTVMQAGAGEVDAVLFTSASGADEWLRAAESTRVLDAVRRRASTGALLLIAAPSPHALLDEANLRATVAARGRVGAFVREAVDHFGSGRRPIVRTTSGAVEMRSGGAVVDGTFIALARNSASVLGALFDAGGHVLSREELVRALPRGRESVHAAEMAIARLREALGTPDIVKTVVKRGYRLNVDESD
jgi:uroporphyrinogen-III synthase